MTSICISSGHGKYIRGAAGSPIPPYLDEVNEARKIVDRVVAILKSGGVPVTFYHDDTSHSQSENLERIVNYHNNQIRELDVSVHLNAYSKTSKPMGTEVLYVSQQALAEKVSAAIAEAGGFIDRGDKKNTGLYFLNMTAKPAILLEICFVDSSADADLYRQNFEAICLAIAETISGQSLDEAPPAGERPPFERPDRPPPGEPDAIPRPTVKQGSYGSNVRELQTALKLTVDGDFGPKTDEAVRTYQRSQNLTVDGIVGPATWSMLDQDFNFLPYPAPMPPVFTPETILEIKTCAEASPVYRYSWNDRGKAPPGFIVGMALAYGHACLRIKMGGLMVEEMSKANTGNEAIDVLAWYDSAFRAVGMSNAVAGRDTLRHLYVFLMGLGMRESSGEHCCGRDMSATNTSSDTAEAGLFQTSWNARNACTDFTNLFDQYEREIAYAEPVIECPQGYLPEFSEGVSCSTSEWGCYGSGDGYTFQEMCKHVPTFAVETCGITLRNLRQHYGPVNRREVEIRPNADLLFKQVEVIVDGLVTGDII